MTAEQIYSLGMAQIGLVFFLASFRIQLQAQHRQSLQLLQALFFFDSVSWVLYVWPEQAFVLALSSVASAINTWLVLAFAIRRAGLVVKWPLLIAGMLIHSAYYSYYTFLGWQSFAMHGQTIFTLLAIGPVCWLFWFKKQPRTFSDQLYVGAMLVWLIVCLSRTLLLLFAPELLLSSLLVSQVIWPGVMVAYGIFAITSYMEETELRLKGEALHDPLTGLLNRRGMLETIRTCLSYLQRKQHPAALLMIDLDYFKKINDSLGHDVGDLVLVEVAEVMALQLRESDVLARFGGEEFLLFLPQISEEQSKIVAERLLAAVSQLDLPVLKPSAQQLSISVGIAHFDDQYDFATQLKRADQALYKAKDLGRCRIEVAAD
ncbi:MAG: GGDEF domain-containing protein [Gammaproteobacteria bacterium]|jgi:diguanylate cyclase (GGDEF)-like protein|nr:GGDEF domain-containing protein [Gammaproteobacteria bacterium]MBU2225572.1 GGDEF domain-containing protein [Gammaproteobacteria bacterium]MBU2280710.1 GGDEF domain-containing protein [Gammaproteobacteria bacterium]MBU2427175.1 GGDEF domain-containing protein [Gammaproteobacteria bacterium]